MSQWRVTAPEDPGIGDVLAASREAVLLAAKIMLGKGAKSLLVYGPDGAMYRCAQRSKKEPNRLTFERVPVPAPSPRTSFAVYWRKRSVRSVEFDDKGRETVVWSETGPWIFHSRWPTRDEAVAAAIKVERSPSGDPAFGVTEDAPDWPLEAKIVEVPGGAPMKAPDPGPRKPDPEAFKATFGEARERAKPKDYSSVEVERKRRK